MGLGSNQSIGTEVSANDSDNRPSLELYFTPSGQSGLTWITFYAEPGPLSSGGNWVLAVPEPSSMMLWGCFAFFGIGGSLRRSKRK